MELRRGRLAYFISNVALVFSLTMSSVLTVVGGCRFGDGDRSGADGSAMSCLACCNVVCVVLPLVSSEFVEWPPWTRCLFLLTTSIFSRLFIWFMLPKWWKHILR